MPEILNEEDDVQRILDEELERIRQWGKDNGVNVRINEKKGPIVIFNPPRSLVDKAKRVKQETKKETD